MLVRNSPLVERVLERAVEVGSLTTVDLERQEGHRLHTPVGRVDSRY